MDLLTTADIKALAEPDPEGLAVSFYMPTHRFGSGVETDKLRWKNLVNGMETLLLKENRRSEVADLLAPARDLQNDSMAWQYLSDGLALLIRPGRSRLLRIPAPMPELAAVGHRPVVGPLLRVLSGEGHFLLLALSQREVRLLEGNRHGLEQVETGDMATALDDTVEPRDPRSDTMARPASVANRGGPAIFYGHGAGDDHIKTDDVQRFLQDVAKGLDRILVGQTLPLVTVGLGALVGGYREANTYPHLTTEAVIHSADDLSPERLHQLAWPLIRQLLEQEQAKVSERFENLSNTDRASTDLATVAESAEQGRVDTLLVNSAPWCYDDVQGDSPLVFRSGTEDRVTECEQIDQIVVSTLQHGGSVEATPEPLASGWQVAAIFRY